MRLFARLAVGALSLAATSGFGYEQPELLACHGDFGRFADGALVARLSQLDFVVDWLKPAIATDDGRAGRITALTALELAFDVQYAGYTASYRVNRIDGSISQASSVGGVFYGVCDLRPLETKF